MGSETFKKEVEKAKRNVLIKQVQYILTKCFDAENDVHELIKELKVHLDKLDDKANGFPDLCHLKFYCKNFLASCYMRIEPEPDPVSAKEWAKQCLNDMQQYYGHIENPQCLDAMSVSIQHDYMQLQQIF